MEPVHLKLVKVDLENVLERAIEEEEGKESDKSDDDDDDVLTESDILELLPEKFQTPEILDELEAIELDEDNSDLVLGLFRI